MSAIGSANRHSAQTVDLPRSGPSNASYVRSLVQEASVAGGRMSWPPASTGKQCAAVRVESLAAVLNHETTAVADPQDGLGQNALLLEWLAHSGTPLSCRSVSSFRHQVAASVCGS